MSQRKLGGALTAMVTPFDSAGELMLEAVAPFLRFQQEAGMDGVVVCGTNGEGPSLSVGERKRMLDAVLQCRGDLLVIAGTGAASVTDAVELTRHAGEAGADAALVLPPFYFKNPTAEGVAASFRRVLDAASLPVLLYSIPQVSCIAVTDEILDLLAGHPRLAGMKDSAGVWDRTSALLRERPGMAIFPGADDLMSRALDAGAVGVISGTGNGFPDLVAGVKRARSTGGDVAAAQARLTAAKTALSQVAPYAGNKSVLAHRGLPRMYVRPPMVDLTPEQERALVARLKDEGLLA